MIDSWRRRWFVLDETKLYYIIDGQDASYQIQNVCDIMLTSVRECKTIDLPFCFEISYANMGSTMVQAEGPKEYNGWWNDLRGAIERRLVSGLPASKYPSSIASPSRNTFILDDKMNKNDISHTSNSYTHSNHNSNSNNNHNNITNNNKREKNISIISQILQKNMNCAECGRNGPDWVSLNLGCLICIDCSGVHRSMGVHISKVQSLTLDDLDMEEYKYILSIGKIISYINVL